MILLTGASGFLGKALKSKFQPKELITVGRHNATVLCDLSVTVPNLQSVTLVIHAAGKAHIVPKNSREKQDFFDVNVIGTENLLKGLKHSSALPKAFIFISSVAVYGLDSGMNISEKHQLNANDPYGLSKVQAENLVQEWCSNNGVICTVLRLPLLVGKNPPGNLGAMIRAIKKGYYFNIAGGKAKKSMVLAEDVSKFIIPASKVGGIYNLTDGYHPNFKELSTHLAKQLNKTAPLNIPQWLANVMAKTGDLIGDKAPFNSYKLSKITSDLTFDDSKASKAFGWKPTPVLEAFKL